MEHTKLPWHNPKYTRRDGNNACWVMDGGKRPEAICRCCGPNAEANAAYIVLACKTFPAMKDAIKEIDNFYENSVGQVITTERAIDAYHKSTMADKIKAALAAGGE